MIQLTHHWPCEAPKCVLLIVHGMTEHLDCYDTFAQWCVSRHIAVAGADLPGHGVNIAGSLRPGDPGPSGWDGIVETAHQAHLALSAMYPRVPIVVLGHSMGSYVVQAMMARYHPECAGVILSATSYVSPLASGFAALLSRFFGVFGWSRRAYIFYHIIYGMMNAPFYPAKTHFDWLSRDEKFVARYMADPHCTFIPPVRFYHALFLGLFHLYLTGLKDFPDVPLYVFSGYEDPLGKRLRAVMPVVLRHRRAGRRVDTMFYPGGRHVMLSETNALEVYEDLARWIEKACSKVQ